MPANFNIGIIGAGRISQAYLDAISELKDVSLSAVLDTRKHAADALAEEVNAKAFCDLDSYLNHSAVEASIICTPPHLHEWIGSKLLSAGQHVLCEKPLALSLKAGIAMFTCAKKHHKQLMMASKFRYVEDLVRAKAMITTGIIGMPIYYENCFATVIDMTNRWNSDSHLSGGGVLADNGTHSADIVHYLLGPIHRVKTRDFSVSHQLKVEDSIDLDFIAEKEIKGAIQLSWSIPLDRTGYIIVYGTEGKLRIGWKTSDYQRIGQSCWTSFGTGYHKIEAFKRQVQNFVETAQGKEAPLISEIESLASIAVIESAYRSLKSGGWDDVATTFE